MQLDMAAIDQTYRKRDSEIAQLQQLQTLLGRQTDSRRNLLDWFHRAFRYCPFPAWLKDSNHVALAVNPAYSEIYETAGDHGLSFVGGRDESWPELVADDFHRYDKKAIEEGYTITHEHVRNPVTGVQESIHGAKWLITLADGDQVVMGIASAITPKPLSALRDRRDGR